MTLTPEERKIIVKSHVTKAEKSLEDAQTGVAILPGPSSRSSYDGVFHITAALLISNGLQVPSTHMGLKKRLDEVFVKGDGSVSKETATIFSRLETDRNFFTYKTNYEITSEKAEENLTMAKKFFAALNILVEEQLNKLDLIDHQEQTSDEVLEKEVLALGLIGQNVKDPSPKIYTKIREDAECRGKILHVSNKYSVQQTGKISLFVHKHDNLDRIPKVGEVVKINYRKGEKAKVSSMEQKNTEKQELSR